MSPEMGFFYHCGQNAVFKRNSGMKFISCANDFSHPNLVFLFQT